MGGFARLETTEVQGDEMASDDARVFARSAAKAACTVRAIKEAITSEIPASKLDASGACGSPVSTTGRISASLSVGGKTGAICKLLFVFLEVGIVKKFKTEASKGKEIREKL